MKIKTIVLLTFTGFFLMVSCSIDNDKSDAYGNFEATEIIVSAQAAGELLRLDLEEGDRIEKDEVVGLIDTTDLWLKKKLLVSQKRSVASQLTSID